jgi:hypothetical protein
VVEPRMSTGRPLDERCHDHCCRERAPCHGRWKCEGEWRSAASHVS